MPRPALRCLLAAAIGSSAALLASAQTEGGLYIAYQGTYRNDITSHGIVAGIRLEF
jgi:hypothetical protein